MRLLGLFHTPIEYSEEAAQRKQIKTNFSRTMFEAVNSKVDFPAEEKATLEFWEREHIFRQSLENRKDSPEYVFYDGPPFATGLPHYGHLLAGTIKDIVPRYHTMRGHYVERRFGWDCHGLPIEALAQEALGLAGAGAIVDTGVDVFNEQCRSMVLTYTQEWRKTVTRMGRWVDFDNDYKTMDRDFMESIWWVFKQLWEKDRVYKAYRIMPYSWKLTTPLSNFEAGNNYQEVQDPAITVRFKVKDGDATLSDQDNVYLMAWTTTPWTLPGNLGLCAGPEVAYVAVKDQQNDDVYVLAEARLSAYFKNEEEYSVLKNFTGADLAGWTYEPLFPYFEGHKNAFQVLTDDFVTTGDGTGIVHLAPAYGEDDYRVCSEQQIELVDPLDAECNFTEPVSEYVGQFCKAADKAIIRRLKDEGKMVHQSTIVHSYPFCERTDTPLIYRAIEAWYVRIEDLRDKLVANNDTIHWVPEYVGQKRFGNWLRDAKDWNISRNRFWGSCIPVWITEDGSDRICVGSIEELETLSGVKVDDLHKHIIDQVTFEKNGKTYRRTPEVLDCWFESGAMPYAQGHYPFENKERFESHFPADFIAEGLDQTRGWFYTLMVLSTILFERPAFKNVVVNGLVLAEDGRKMSKRLKNYPDPNEVINAYGADALRLYLINSPVVRAEDFCFTEDGVKHALRHLLIPLWNAYSFFITYARIDHWTPTAHQAPAATHALDQWIMSSLNRLSGEVTDAMDQYDLQKSIQPFVQFIEDLTNWYIRQSRRRFWKSTDDDDKQSAYATLYTVLVKLCKIAAPFVPFISESIYRNLRAESDPVSVHLCDFPDADNALRKPELENQMAVVMSAVRMGRAIRSEREVKTRQPLKGIHVVCREEALLKTISTLDELIKRELNVHEVWYSSDETELVDFHAKPNFKTLGPRLGPNVKLAASEIQSLASDQLERLMEDQLVTINIKGESFELHPNDVVIERIPKPGLAVGSEGHLVVALEMEITEALILEGLAREFVNKVQNMRKNMGLEVTDRIAIQFQSDGAVTEAIALHEGYIKAETLSLQLDGAQGLEGAEPWDLNGHACVISVVRS